ncbi:MAG: 2-C-methyl-D-erythritol 4-phosphate cytidylyltransferase [Acidobacteriota bacterium]|nr:2-C-methyl-D-erythritol 4-phosphate cytidylyltransferase [Acidobacteriota bacterium]
MAEERITTRVGAVVVAAGAGTRFGAGAAPKQFQPVLGLPLVVHAVRAVLASEKVARLVVVLPEEGFESWQADLGPHLGPEGGRVSCCPGGASRQESTSRGLEALDARFEEEEGAVADLVAVHDGARPAPPLSLVEEVIEAARRHGAAIPGCRPPDTLWSVTGDGRVERLVDRDHTVAVQTPQCFRRSLLTESLARAKEAGLSGTDEASLVRAAGHPVRVVEGSHRNLKVTRPADLEVARSLLGGASGMPRLGFGFDAHRFGTTGTLQLGGIAFPGVPSLEGHSDGDAVLHALTDAILGAVAGPDIGALFPSSDPALRGAASERFVRRALEIAARAGYGPGQVDLTVVAERPRLAPRIEEMRGRLGGMLGIAPGAVGLKATTTDGMGFTGRGEGLVAKALVRLDPHPRVPEPAPPRG